MTRRKLVALVGAAVLFTIGLLVVSTGLFLTHTDTGRAQVKSWVVPVLRSKFPNANFYVGKVSGSLINGIEIDSIAIRDKRGELFVSTGRVRLEWNWRDLIDYRFYVTHADIQHPYVHIVQFANGNWNFREVFQTKNSGAPEKPKTSATRGIGDYVVLDSVAVHDATFLLTMPWHPDDTLKGRARDSVIKFHLETPSKMVAKTFDGYGRTYTWRNGGGLISHIRLADPDSNKFGQLFRIATLSVDEYEPTFHFRNLRGDAIHRGDTVEIRIPHFEMPKSYGSATGRVWWGSDLPVRYGIDIHGDSVALDDVNWVYPTLPRTGGGSLDLLIRNDPKNLSIVDFRLQNMDVRSTGSHLTGNMWFGIGAPVLLVRNVDLNAQPMTFDLLRTLNGGPFPFDWRGDLFGTVKARGGPLTHFVVDDARARFEDAHVRGAVSRFTARGELDILQPKFTAFHGFNVDVAQLDLRTIEYLNPNFPRLGGFISGTATLDSSWLDVRFSNAHLAHQDGPGEPTRVSGSGRVTYGDLLAYDLTLDAQPLNATMLARSETFKALPVRGLFSGPMRIRGTAPDLEITTTLESQAGALSFAGRVDVDSIGGYAARGQGQFSNLDVGALLEKTGLPTGVLSGHYDVNLDSIGVTPSSVRGVADVSIDRTLMDSIRVLPSHATVRFANGQLLVDTLHLVTDAFTAEAHGGVGLPEGTPDSLRFSIYVDSLGGLRPLISHPKVVPGLAVTADSLSGSARLTGVASGTLDALQLSGELAGSHLYVNKDRGDSLAVRFDLRNALTPDRTGLVSLRVDSVTVAGIALDTVGGVLAIVDSMNRQFTIGAASHNGPTARGGGRWIDGGSLQTIEVDSLGLAVGESQWQLASPARITIDSNSTRVDSLLLRNRDSGFVALVANVPALGPAMARLEAAALPLTDVGVLAQLADTLYGTANLSIAATGAKARPIIDATTTLSSVKYSGYDVDRVVGSARYRDERLIADAQAVRRGVPALTATANWPYDITLFSVAPRNDTLSARIKTDTTDLALLAPLFPKGTVDSLRGRLFGNLGISGTTAAKVYEVNAAIGGGQARVIPAGIIFREINADLNGGMNAAGQDSINVTVSAQTSAHDHATLSGWVTNLFLGDKARFGLQLTADSLHAFNRRTIADVYLSTTDPLKLTGPITAPVLTGGLNVDRGAIFLADPDLARKLAVEMPIDQSPTTRQSNASMLTTLMTNLRIVSVPVTLGEDVRLRSTVADVRLSGQLELVKSNVPSRIVRQTGEFVPGLSLNGTLYTTNGTYNLNLGIVQREFAVLPGGTVTFDGSSPETPLVDIKARYNVKQFKDRDLGVIVNLKGRMPNPTIEFGSDAEYTIAQSDLLSYLIIGAPGFDFGADKTTQQVIAQVLSPTVSAFVADRLRQQLGGLVSSFQFELGNYNIANSSAINGRNITGYLSTATISAEQRVFNTDLYLGVNTGLCGIERVREGSLSGFGVKAEYRFRPDLSFQATYDPAALSRTSCLNDNGQQALLGLIPSPSQFSFAVRHTWRF
jgi:translocation and assembly module TamB